jgi:hypothetical protein
VEFFFGHEDLPMAPRTVSSTAPPRTARRALAGALTAAALLAVPALALVWLSPATGAAWPADPSIAGLFALDGPATEVAALAAHTDRADDSAQAALADDDDVTTLDDWQETGRHRPDRGHDPIWQRMKMKMKQKQVHHVHRPPPPVLVVVQPPPVIQINTNVIITQIVIENIFIKNNVVKKPASACW